jgi:hypothetical protein
VKKIKAIVAIAAFIFLVNGCYLDQYKDIEEIKIESFAPTFGFPVLNSSISIKDLLKAVDSTDIVLVKNDSIIINYNHKESFTVDLNTFKVPDKDFEFTLPLSNSGLHFYNEDYVTIANDSKIKSVELKAGKFWVEFETVFTTVEFFESDLEITSLKIFQGGSYEPMNVHYSFAEHGAVHRDSFPLTDAILELFEDVNGEILYNTFSYVFGINSTNAYGDVIVRMGFSGIQFKRMTGLINYAVDLPTQDIDMSAFSSIVDGQLSLKDPKINIQIGTSFGVPASAEISEFKFMNSSYQKLFLRTIDGLDNTFNIGAGKKNYLPYIWHGEEYHTSVYKLNGINSNVEEILPFSPSRMTMRGVFTLGDYEPNTVPEEEKYDFFVNDTSSFDLNLGIEIPLAGSIQDLKFAYDMYDMSWPSPDDANLPIKDFDYEVELIIKTNNGIPLTFGLQVYFLLSNNVLETLFDGVDYGNIIVSPPIDAQGNPIGKQSNTTSIKMSKAKYDNIRRTDKLSLNLLLNTGTEQQRDVIIKASQSLDFQLAVKFNINVDPN